MSSMRSVALDTANEAGKRRPQVGIFRLQLFKPSEGFITSQGDALRDFDPVYIGRRIFGPQQGRTVAVPAAQGRFAKMMLAAQMVGLQDTNPFMRLRGLSTLDLIHAHFAIDAVYSLSLAKRMRIPLITTLHGFDVTRSDVDMLKSARPNLAHGVLKRRILQRDGDLFICVSDFIKQKAIERGFPEEKLLRHYIGIDCERLKMRSGAGETGLIVHVARLVEKKGTAYLLRAFAKIASTHKDARLVVIGEGPLRPQLERFAHELGIAEQCAFVGVQPNSSVLEWTSRASVQVVSSVRGANGDMEGFGIVNIEAGAQGVPVVAFDSGGIGEAVRHEHSGLLVPERDVEGLAVAIQRLLESSNMRLAFGEAARDVVDTNFNLRIQTAALERIYSMTISQSVN